MTEDEAVLQEIKVALPSVRARVIATRTGTMHSLWDVIFDAEEALAGRQTILPPLTILAELRKG